MSLAICILVVMENKAYWEGSRKPLTNYAKSTGRHGLHDTTMILMAFGHGLWVSELVSLCWSHVDLKHGLPNIAY